MRRIVRRRLDPRWAKLVTRPATAQILQYVHDTWRAYVIQFGGQPPPLRTRTEPALSQGLAAYLEKEFDAGRQPFHGEFVAERQYFDLQGNGMPTVRQRTDLELRITGFAALVIEFKVLGYGRRASQYIRHGVQRFVDGRYGHQSQEGAMFAFVDPGAATRLISQIERAIDTDQKLNCVSFGSSKRRSPSRLAPQIANFDSKHQRSVPTGDIELAHLFVMLPP